MVCVSFINQRISKCEYVRIVLLLYDKLKRNVFELWTKYDFV